MANKKFNYEKEEDLTTIYEQFSDILTGLKNNCLTFKTSKDEVILYPKSPMKIKIKAEKKGKECKLTMRLTWKEQYKKMNNGIISISS